MTDSLDHDTEPFGIHPADVGDLPCLDVRRAAVHAEATTMLPGATWRGPATVADWGPALARAHPPGQPLVVYCVHGHAVSRGAVLALRAAGGDARFLRGGITAWAAEGRPVVAKP